MSKPVMRLSAEMKKWKKITELTAEIRGFEEAIEDVYAEDMIESPVHLSIGQELISVLAGLNSEREDVIVGTYRSHAITLARSEKRAEIIDELCGTKDGIYGGRAGSMHLGDPDANMPWTSAIVGSGVPIAAGAAQACKWDEEGGICICLFGDGAIEEGGVLETLNIASSRGLPLLMILEDNDLAIYTKKAKRSHESFSYKKLAEAFGIKYTKATLKEVFKLEKAMHNAFEYCRREIKPILFHVECYRWRQHVGINGDFDRGYRTEKELIEWVENDIIEGNRFKYKAEFGAFVTKEHYRMLYADCFRRVKKNG